MKEAMLKKLTAHLNDCAWKMADAWAVYSNSALITQEVVMKKDAAVTLFNAALQQINDVLIAQEQQISVLGLN